MRLFVYTPTIFKYSLLMKTATSSAPRKPVFFLQIPANNGFPLVAIGRKLMVKTKGKTKQLKLTSDSDLSVSLEGNRIAIYDKFKRLALLSKFDSIIVEPVEPQKTPQVYFWGENGFYPQEVVEATHLIHSALQFNPESKEAREGIFEMALNAVCKDSYPYPHPWKDEMIDLGVPLSWAKKHVEGLKVRIGNSQAAIMVAYAWGQFQYMFSGTILGSEISKLDMKEFQFLLQCSPSGIQRPDFFYPQPIEGSKEGLLLFLRDSVINTSTSDCFNWIHTTGRDTGKRLTEDREFDFTKGMVMLFCSYLRESAKVLLWMACMRDKTK